MTLRAIISLIGISCILAGCGNSTVKQLRHAEPKGTPHQQALQRYYLAFAEDEQDYGRDAIAQRAAEKGLNAAYGKTTTTEALKDGEYQGYKQELRKAHIAFSLVNTEHYHKNLPDDVAKTQSLYDCWAWRAEAGAPKDQIEFCQQSFYNAFTLMTHKSDRKQYDAIIKNPDAQNAELSTSYLIYFEWDKAQLNDAAKQNLNIIAKQLLGISESFTLAINGHTDTSGSEEYNRKLSEARASTIQTMLLQFGVSKAIMTIFAFGESDPLVKTEDGVKEEKNRRVEIFIE
jgi:OmpA-OmpF porin, OOP family